LIKINIQACKKLAVSFLLTILLLVGCKGTAPQRDIVAKVDDVYLTRDIVMTLIPENLNAEDRKFFMKRVIEQWIDNQTLARKARQEGIELSTKDQWQLNNLETDMLATKYLDSKIKVNFMPTDKDIEDYYNANQEQFKRRYDEVHLIHVYFEQLDKTIQGEIRQSKSLLDVIKKNYLDRQINRVMEPNGDLGYVPEDQIRDKFRQAIRGTKTGVIYGPIRADDGYHYLQVLDRQPAGSIRDLDLVRDEITTYLRVAKRHQAIKLLKEETRKEFSVETFYDNIL
jgi:parvulin-like peptidyl-prolyl isomerase